MALNADLKSITHPNKINVICMECQTKNALTIHSKEVEEQLLLGCLDAGIGHSLIWMQFYHHWDRLYGLWFI